MFKLMILIEAQEDFFEFEKNWPKFLALAEKMPGLQHEVNSPVYTTLTGAFRVTMIHELFFNTQDELRRAMSSPEGIAAGKMLQNITKGKVSLLFAQHLEDAYQNIAQHQGLAQDNISGEPA